MVVMKKILLILLIAHFLKQLFWMAVIPIWHFPDEEQHFGQTSFYAEKGYFPKGKAKFDVSKEIDRSSELFGTKRDGRGINKFTYHPEYRTPYLNGEIGLYEKEIKKLNTKENRQTMVKREAARYGPIYYFLTAIPYKIFFEEDLFVRVFSSRFISVILSTITVFIVYLIAKEIFKSELLRLSLVFLTAFQPMFSFVSAGVNSDNLFNLIFTLILYFCLKLFFSHKGPSLYSQRQTFSIALLTMVLILGFYTKKQIYISLPIIFFAFFLSVFKKKKKKSKKQLLLLLSLIVIGFFALLKGKIRIPEYDPDRPSALSDSLFQYLFWHLKHTISETIPWYWGVFNWLGVTLPRWVNRFQSRLLIVSAFGILFYFFKEIKKKKLFTRSNLRIIFLLGSAGIYYFSIIFWDYFFRKSQGFTFGIQGRYFFPTIVSHLLLIILGLTALIPQKFKTIIIKIFVVWWLFFSLIGLHTAVSAYYQIWPFYTFLDQVSQYKPAVFKGMNVLIVFSAFIISILVFIIKFLRINERKIK